MRPTGACLLIVTVLAAGAFADDLVRVYVNGAERTFDPGARVRDGLAYAPLRAAAEAVGAEVKWDASAQRAIICTDRRCVEIAKEQGIIVDGRLLVPLRLMSEALGCSVLWDASAHAVRITTQR